jgi:hypothetical protein
MVMVYDENGEQIPAYQGYYADVKERILQDAGSGSVFNHWFGYSPVPVPVVPERW